MKQSIVEAIDREFHPDTWESMSRHIAALERTFCYRQFAESARYCFEQMEAAGLADTHLFELAADGRTTYMDYIMPQAWDVRSAELEIVEPEAAAQPLIDYASNPLCVANRCAPTPPEGIVAEVITVEQFDALDSAEGKIVYAGERGISNLRHEAAAKGAAGLITDRSPAREIAPEETCWINGWCTPGWYQTAEHPDMLCFSLSPAMGQRLKAQLDAGPVRVRAAVDADLYDGSIYTATGLVPGQTEREIILMAHIYEPFICDDAAGAAALIEVARTLKALIDRGELPRPKLGIRVLVSMERYGFAHYFAKEEVRRRAALAISMDTICLAPAKTGQAIQVRYSPASQPFWGDMLLWQMSNRLLEGYSMATMRGNLSDDTFMADTAIGVPVQWAWTPVGATHHTSLWLQEEYNDWPLGARIAKMIAAYVTDIASAEAEDLARYGRLLLKEQNKELRTHYQAWSDMVARGELSAEERDGRARFLTDWQRGRVRSLGAMYPEADAEALLAELTAQQEEIVGPLADAPTGEVTPLSPTQARARDLIPSRTALSLPFSQARIPLQERIPANYDQALNWIDGRRSLLDVARQFAYETERAIDDEWLAHLTAYCEKMAEYGYIGLTTRASAGA